jgi:hypothetical protein
MPLRGYYLCCYSCAYSCLCSVMCAALACQIQFPTGLVVLLYCPCALEFLPRGTNRLWHEADHSLLSRSECNNSSKYYLHSPHTSSFSRCLIKNRENINILLPTVYKRISHWIFSNWFLSKNISRLRKNTGGKWIPWNKRRFLKGPLSLFPLRLTLLARYCREYNGYGWRVRQGVFGILLKGRHTTREEEDI